MSKERKAIYYFIIIFGFVTVLLGGFIFSTLNFKKDKDSTTLKLENDMKIAKEIKKHILKSAYVCDDVYDESQYQKYIHIYSINDTGIKMDVSGLHVPYFNLKSDETTQINEHMHTLYCSYLNRFKDSYQKFTYEGYSDVSKMHFVGPLILNYNAYLYKDILSVVMYHKNPDNCYSYETYLFNTKTNKLLGVEEISKLLDFDFVNYDFHSILNKFYDGAQGNMLASTSIYNINDSLKENKINIVRPTRESEIGIGIYIDNNGSINMLLPINQQTVDNCGQKISLVTLK